MLIKPIPSLHMLAGVFATAALVACANPGGEQDHAEHHEGQSANAAGPGSSAASPSTGGMMGQGMTQSDAGSGQHTDKDTMCAMYRSMQSAPNDQERQAMMDRQMPGMSPEMRQQHMNMMRQQCQ